jgi:hypothetical protein
LTRFVDHIFGSLDCIICLHTDKIWRNRVLQCR